MILGICNHSAAIFYYAESVSQIQGKETMIGRECDSWKNFENENCNSEDHQTIIMGLSKYPK